jgi:hypothetical protein
MIRRVAEVKERKEFSVHPVRKFTFLKSTFFRFSLGRGDETGDDTGVVDLEVVLEAILDLDVDSEVLT